MITKEKIHKWRWRHLQNNKDNTPDYPAPKPSPCRFCISMSCKDGKKLVKLILKVRLRQPSTARRQELPNWVLYCFFWEDCREEARNQNPSFLAYIRFAEKKHNKAKPWIWRVWLPAFMKAKPWWGRKACWRRVSAILQKSQATKIQV